MNPRGHDQTNTETNDVPKLLNEKLEHLKREEVTTVDPAAKFKISNDIRETESALSALMRAGTIPGELGLNAVDNELLKSYFDQCANYEPKFLPHANGDVDSIGLFLNSRGLAFTSTKGALALTNAGVIFCAREEYICSTHFHVEVDFQQGAGTAISKEKYRGSVLHLHHVLLKRLDKFEFRVVGIPGERDVYGGEKAISEYPRVALIEALANFLIHRDYSKDDFGRINVYSDRIEFINPGLSFFSPETLLNSEKDLEPNYERNPRLIEAMSLARLNQRRGSGVRRIRELLHENGTCSPNGGPGLELLNDFEKCRFHLIIFRRDLRRLLMEEEESIIPAAVHASAPAKVDFKADLSRIDRYAPEKLIGREAELQLLDQAWGQAVNAETLRPRVLALVAMGGEGKTSLVAKWAAQLAHTGWTGCDAVFAWSFYSQGTREQTAASSDLFLAEALRFFGDAAMAQSSQSAFDKARRLAQLVGGQRALLILDGLEPLQYAPTSPTPGELRDGAMAALLRALATNSLGLCVLTTRHAVADLRNYLQTTVLEHHLLRLSQAAGVHLLQSLGVHGSAPELAAMVQNVCGHALSLNLLGSYLRDAHSGDVRKRDQVKLEEADAEAQGGHAFRIMDTYVQWFTSPDKNAKEAKRGQRAIAVLKILGLFDRAASAECLHALLKNPSIDGLTEAFTNITEAQRHIVYARLEDANLIRVNRDATGALLSLDAHPLVREYFGQTLKEEQPQAWRDAHRRIYEYLCATTKEGKQPSLEDLKPLYQAVAHGCQAGMQQEACDAVYNARILRGNEAYSVRQLGAFASDLGAVACFFEQPWSRVDPKLSEAAQSWMMNQSAFNLSALGRLVEALEPMRAGLAMRVKQKDWRYAAISAGNLSQLELTLGQIDGDGPASAVRDASQSVVYADRSGDAFSRMNNRAVHADALHQAGRRTEALLLFQEAEALQTEIQQQYPLLYSLSGFQYADLLLTEAARSVWRSSWYSGKPLSQSEALGEVDRRATKTLEWMQADSGAPLLALALNHLTVGRTALYVAVLQTDALSSGLPAWVASGRIDAEIQQAVDGLRRAGQQQFIPLGLLTRAWLRHLQGHATGFDSAQTDLDEAWEIAERGPMPLHMADIHLHRARLFMRDTCYPWDKAEDGTSRGPADDLREARRLIVKHGYGRRLEELQDAEEALHQWQSIIPAKGDAS